MGSEVSVAAGATLHVVAPRMVALPKDVEPPSLVTRLLKAKEGGWDEVARTTGAELDFTPTEPGAYRAEVRLTPTHLMSWVGRSRGWLADERPWVYSNAIYVVP